MIKKLLGAILVILLLFGVCATLEKEVSPDGTATQTETMWQMAIHSLSESVGQIKDGVVDIFKAVTSENKADTKAEEIGEISVDELPKEAKKYYKRYVDENWETTTDDLEGKTHAGDPFENEPRKDDETKLPEVTKDGTSITYKEFDAETTPKGKKRGKKRFVHGSDGSTYYTDDHYKTFKKVKNS